MHKAMFWKKEKNYVQCELCPQNCRIPEKKRGLCGVRQNIKGELYTLVYGKAAAYHVDPVEKKPLFHFLPGTKIYSIGTLGCNLRCSFCQNWEISQTSKQKDSEIYGIEMTPEEAVKNAIANNCKSIALTYNEPTIFFEYAYDICRQAKKHKLKTVFVSNGFINKKPIEKISKYLDAVNIDIKSFNEDFYKKTCGASLNPILEAVKAYYKKNIWIEITTLIIPGENDSEKELEQITGFIASIDKNLPWHISAFHPDYKMTSKESTPISSLEKAYEIGKRSGLSYIYTGNVLRGRENTYCPNCKKAVIKRFAYNIIENSINNGLCMFCDSKIKGIF
jgi:pyruvate formate lyase activating enzyme